VSHHRRSTAHIITRSFSLARSDRPSGLSSPPPPQLRLHDLALDFAQRVAEDESGGASGSGDGLAARHERFLRALGARCRAVAASDNVDDADDDDDATAPPSAGGATAAAAAAAPWCRAAALRGGVGAYVFGELGFHLRSARRAVEAAELLGSHSWLRAKVRKNGVQTAGPVSFAVHSGKFSSPTNQS